ncbi:hypothetical protein W02_19150 [Nitrospira sp. KM1]|uniref:CgeB family protein n=1 Tax=Nitrospira sp. KM1 TaxID=1936990 RepID=UPI0013A71E3D|nr:glycosyltransferase [Nitrospira sp. KM1]BCA54775.1 hypothetical protein W02_19150 [Nitrospira sp. KM1]
MNHFAQNIERIRKHNPALAQAVMESGACGMSIQTSREGSPSAMHNGQWIHSSYDPRKEAHSWAAAQVKDWKDGELGVVLGVGLLYHVEALVAAKGRDLRVAVVVPDLSFMKEAITVRSVGNWFDEVEWLWGPQRDLATQLSGHKVPLRFFTFASAARLHAAHHQELETALRHAITTGSGQLHVAVVGPIYGGSLPIAGYAVRALEGLGHRVTWIDHHIHYASYEAFGTVRDSRNRLALQSRFADVLSLETMTRLADDPPDLVLALAQAPLTMAVLEHLRKKKFVTAMWFVENYRHLTYWQQLAAGYEYWFVFQREECIEALKRAGAPHVSYLPMAADPEIHCPRVLTEGEQSEFKSDVSFVGAGYANRRALLPRWLSPEWTFRLWGNEWDGASNLRHVLQREGRRIDTDTCVKVFNASSINLNLHSWSGDGLDVQADFVNPRTFELAACGAFQLVDDRRLLPEVFTEGEVVRFKNAADVPRLIRHWLNDADARHAIASAGRQRVLREHTYRDRMRELLTTIGFHQPDRIGAILRGDRDADRMANEASSPELVALLRRFPAGRRVELKDVAAEIRSRGAGHSLGREEMLILMMDSYRAETRDLV